MDITRGIKQLVLTDKKIKTMKKYILSIIVLLVGLNLAFSQETTTGEKEKDVPVVAPFESGLLIDNQTCVIPTAKTLEFVIQHRFGTVDKGIENIYGIYSSANIRLGLNYSILNNLQIGYGLTRNKMYSDFQVKWNVLQQTRKNTIPVAVTLWGDMAIDGRANTVFEGVGEDSAYSFSNRISYFGQLIVGRKFSDRFSLQATASFTHFNKVAGDLDHDKIGVGINGRVKFSPQSSVIFQYDMPLAIKGITEQKEFINAPHTNVALGYEVSTGTHVFQIYISNANGIVPQEIYMNNHSDPRFISNWLIGFTMTRLWGF
jgi:hypothetical protein